MKYMIIPCLALFVMACNNSKNNSAATASLTTDTVKNATNTKQTKAPVATSLCFLRTEGATRRDSTSVELVVKGDKITGLMNWLPYQKDSRKGTLTGRIKNDTITATWAFMQEGMKDTLNVKFLLKNDSLFQKPLALNTKTGRQQTNEAADYTLSFNSSAQLHK